MYVSNVIRIPRQNSQHLNDNYNKCKIVYEMSQIWRQSTSKRAVKQNQDTRKIQIIIVRLDRNIIR